MAKKKKVSAVEIADQLEVIRMGMADQKKIERQLTAQLLERLHEEQITHAGNYKITKADTFKVAVDELALPFALQRGLVKVDTAKIKKVFQLDVNLNKENDPTKYGFEVITQEKITPIRGYDDDETL